ncbi:MAG: response regulator [Bacteroidales bacterium]|nr:response regulator [Bacteroidales bacterium]MDD3700006.1 response regulator [Bacteroidales bacterium]MDY0368778.1 response regulator [Bacteroidales bacterium]
MKNLKILVVDDDLDVITVLEQILEAEGYEVISAFNKQEGIALALEHKPDLAILDVMMTTHYEGFEMAKEFVDRPELQGIPTIIETSIEVLMTTKPSVQAMAREFRNDPNYKELQVILIRDIVTGNAGIDYRAEDGRSVWVPVNGFIRKPVDKARLLPEIERVLARKAAGAEI